MAVVFSSIDFFFGWTVTTGSTVYLPQRVEWALHMKLDVGRVFLARRCVLVMVTFWFPVAFE